MNIKDLRRLKSWLEIKMEGIHNTAIPTNSDEYSDANLSIEVLRYIQHCIDREVRLDEERQREVTRWYPDPFHTNYPDSGLYSLDTEETICKSCKAQNPHHKYCVHKTKL